MVAVLGVRRGDVDGVDLGVGDELLVGPVGARDRELVGEACARSRAAEPTATTGGGCRGAWRSAKERAIPPGPRNPQRTAALARVGGAGVGEGRQGCGGVGQRAPMAHDDGYARIMNVTVTGAGRIPSPRRSAELVERRDEIASPSAMPTASGRSTASSTRARRPTSSTSRRCGAPCGEPRCPPRRGLVPRARSSSSGG